MAFKVSCGQVTFKKVAYGLKIRIRLNWGGFKCWEVYFFEVWKFLLKIFLSFFRSPFEPCMSGLSFCDFPILALKRTFAQTHQRENAPNSCEERKSSDWVVLGCVGCSWVPAVVGKLFCEFDWLESGTLAAVSSGQTWKIYYFLLRSSSFPAS